MAIDLELLQRLSPEQGMAYLREQLAGGMDRVGEGVPITNYYADNPVGYYGEGGAWEGGGSDLRNVAVIPAGGDAPAYLAEFDRDGNFIGVGRQPGNSWWENEVFGVPIGALLPLAAAGTAAYFAPAAAGSGGISPGVMAGLETAVPGAGLTPGTVTLSAADLAAAGIGTETLPMLEMAATVGEGAAVPGLGTGTFGMNPATWTTPALAAMESSTLPALTAAGEGILGATIPSGAAITAATTGGGLLEGLLTGRNLASVAAGIYGAATSGDTRGGTTTATREPWAPAQPYLMGLLADNNTVLEHRKAMPWTDQYKAGTQNLANRADAFGASLPGLLGFVNQGMSQQPYQPQFMPQAMRPAAVTGAPAPVTDYFQTPTRSTYGAIDWNAMNPFLRRT